MAKRKRLTPAKAEYLTAPSGLEIKAFGPQSGKVPGPPIAQVSGDAAAAAALSEVSAVLQLAREEGRMIQSLPLSAIEGAHLVRDRLAGEPGAMGAADEDWQALKDSLQSRGQQVPIEVLELGAGRYGLISGWRRLTALRQLAAEQGAEQGGEQRTRAPEVLALIRRPETSAEAYVAMVEENEIRLGLSFFERARIVVQAVDQRVYDSEKQALQSLFSTARAAKRSKIKSFIPLVRELGDLLRFPTHVPEKLGLMLSRALSEDAGFAARVRAALEARPPESPEAEARILNQALKRPAEPVSKPPRPELVPGIALSSGRGRVVLDGDRVTPEFVARLQDWIRRQG